MPVDMPIWESRADNLLFKQSGINSWEAHMAKSNIKTCFLDVLRKQNRNVVNVVFYIVLLLKLCCKMKVSLRIECVTNSG